MYILFRQFDWDEKQQLPSMWSAGWVVMKPEVFRQHNGSKKKKKSACSRAGQALPCGFEKASSFFLCLILEPINYSGLNVLFLAALLPKGSASHSPHGSPSKQPSERGSHRNPQTGLAA